MGKRLVGLALAAGSVLLLGACGGTSDKSANTADTTAAAASTPAPATPAATPPATPEAPAAAPAGGTAKPATGKTWDVKMIGDDKGYRYVPATLTLKVGDAIKFTNVSGGPHNVAFNTVPSGANAQLDANMPATTAGGSSPKLGAMSSPLLVTPNDTYTVSFAGVPPGQYLFNCTPHMALGMKGSVTVQ